MNYKKILKTFFVYVIAIVLIDTLTSPYKNNILLYTILKIIFLIITLFALLKISKIEFKSIKKLSKKDYLTTIIIFSIFTALTLLSTYIINKFISIPLNEELVRKEFIKYPILSIISSCLITPIIEELLFRYNFKDIKNKYLYIIITTLFFSLLHLSSLNEILYLIPYSFMGIMFSYSYIKTNNLLSPIICHILYNIINVIILFYF